jgi:hypothetical protein
MLRLRTVQGGQAMPKQQVHYCFSRKSSSTHAFSKPKLKSHLDILRFATTILHHSCTRYCFLQHLRTVHAIHLSCIYLPDYHSYHQDHSCQCVHHYQVDCHYSAVHWCGWQSRNGLGIDRRCIHGFCSRFVDSYGIAWCVGGGEMVENLGRRCAHIIGRVIIWYW